MPEDLREQITKRHDARIVGTPQPVVSRLSALVDETGSDEIVITTIAHEFGDRLRSYELLAAAWLGQEAEPVRLTKGTLKL